MNPNLAGLFDLIGLAFTLAIIVNFLVRPNTVPVINSVFSGFSGLIKTANSVTA